MEEHNCCLDVFTVWVKVHLLQRSALTTQANYKQNEQIKDNLTLHFSEHGTFAGALTNARCQLLCEKTSVSIRLHNFCSLPVHKSRKHKEKARASNFTRGNNNPRVGNIALRLSEASISKRARLQPLLRIRPAKSHTNRPLS